MSTQEKDRDNGTSETRDTARGQAIAQAESIVAYVAALECDYERLEELRDEKESLQADVDNAVEEKESVVSAPDSVDAEMQKAVDDANKALREWNEENGEELAELEAAAGDCKDEEQARERIQEDPLSVEYRSSWQSVGETLEASEFMILLCTGGPAVRIVGELDRCMCPACAWIEYQDWGTPWTHIVNAPIEQSTLLTYCNQFWFGE